MSIVASVKVHDGVALGADSVSQITGRDGPGQAVSLVKAYRHADKLFPLDAAVPIGVATFGLGNIGSRSIGSYVTEFGSRARDAARLADRSVQAVTDELLGFLREPYQAAFGQVPPDRQPALGIFVAGYSPASPLAEEWEFSLPRDGAAKAVRPVSEFGASWRGLTRPFTRLYRGFDPRIQARLRELGVSPAIIERVKTEFPALAITFDGMPLQDAVNFVHFIISTTVYVANFEVGVASCGGPIDIAVITRSGGFRWLAHKAVSAPGGTYAD